ncbi:nitroreductase family protein [Photobacterium leiognathi]|uniref:nitroreductase family protein n=1 Tax=Photobacterium leiognathi TaxID=553611 RepID=UPI00298251DB|nr:nitroreductase family protein [Photobacterium leiognathi]
MIRKLKNIVKKIQLEMNFFYDYLLFKKYYTAENKNKNNKDALRSWILQDKHRIEKAFSLPEPRPGFGQMVLNRLSDNLLAYNTINNKDYIYYIGVGAIKSYEKFHLENKFSIPQFYPQIKEKFSDDFSNRICDMVGYRKIQKIENSSEIFTFESFSDARKSCRNFDYDKSKEINEELIFSVIDNAKNTPSVCNRQHWHVHVFSGEKKNSVLSFQNGNTGFTDNIPFVALITSDLSAFYTVDERNQPFTDGGMFAMNFMYSLQAKGLSSCALNWCTSFYHDNKFHKLGYIPANHRIVVAIAFGIESDNYITANSPRLETSSLYTIHK